MKKKFNYNRDLVPVLQEVSKLDKNKDNPTFGQSKEFMKCLKDVCKDPEYFYKVVQYLQS